MTTGAHGVPARTANWTLLVLFLINVFNVGDRTLLGVVTEPVRIELGLSDTQMSLANGFLFVVFNLVGGLLIARLVDRGNRKRILAIGLAGWSLATAATSLADNFFILSLARIGIGIGEATAFPAAMSLIPDLFRPHARGRAVAVFQSSSFIGIVGGTILAGVLAAVYGWRAMFVFCGAGGLLLTVLLVVSVREPERELPPNPDMRPPLFEDLVAGCRRFFTVPGFPALLLAFGIAAMMAAVLGAWGPTFLLRSHGIPLARVGLAIGPAVGIGGIAGTLVSGYLADRLAQKHGSAAAMLRVPLAGLPLSIPFMAGFLFIPSLPWAMVSAGIMNFLLSAAVTPCVLYAVSRAAPSDRGITATIMLASSGLVGGALGPFIVGLLSDAFAGPLGVEGLRYAMASMIVTPLLAVMAIVFAFRATPRGLAAEAVAR